MLIDRVSNPDVSTQPIIKAPERVTPPPPVEDVLKKMEKQPEQKHQELDKEKMEEVVKGINDFLQPVNTSIKFVLHDKLNDYYVTIVDDKTKEVIKEIPSKKLLDTYANMMEYLGLMVDKKI